MKKILLGFMIAFLLPVPHARAQVVAFTGDGTDQTRAVSALLSHDGNYLFQGIVKTGPISVKNRTLTIDFAPGAVLQPVSRLDILWQFTNSNVTLKTFTVDGQGLAQAGYKDNAGTLIATDIEMTNMGWPDQKATAGVFGVFLNGTQSANVAKMAFANFHSVGNGIYGDALGEVRGFYEQNAGPITVGSFSMSGGDGTEDNDYFHAQLGNAGGTIGTLTARYNGFTRRVFKAQSGNWTIQNVDVKEGPDFRPDSSLTQTGTHNLNAIDYASGSLGSIDVIAGYIDCSGFPTCICDSGGGGTVTTESGLTMQGSTLKNIKNDPGTGGMVNRDTVGFGNSPTDSGSGMSGTTLINFGTGATLYGPQSFARNVKFIDPVDYATVIGSSRTLPPGIVFTGNQVETRTPGYLNNTQIVEVYSGANLTLTNNTLTENGNTTHAKKFIRCVGLGSTTGMSSGNTAPAKTVPMTPGTCSFVMN